MAFVLPTFNLLCDVWNVNNFNLVGGLPDKPPRLTGVECNLAWGKRVNVTSTGGTGQAGIPIASMTLLFPSDVVLYGPEWQAGQDVVEVPAGSRRWYLVVMTDFIGCGFANEHRGAMLYATAGLWT